MTDLVARLQALGLLALADSWQDVVALVTTKRWSFTQAIEHVVALEEMERARRGLERRQRRSKLERYKPMADFDWNWPEQIDALSSSRLSPSTSCLPIATSFSPLPRAWARP